MSGPEDAHSPLGQLENLFACWGIGLGEDDIETGGDGRKLIGNSVPHNNHSSLTFAQTSVWPRQAPRDVWSGSFRTSGPFREQSCSPWTRQRRLETILGCELWRTIELALFTNDSGSYQATADDTWQTRCGTDIIIKYMEVLTERRGLNWYWSFCLSCNLFILSGVNT